MQSHVNALGAEDRIVFRLRYGERCFFFLVVVRDSVRDGKTKCSTIESRLGMGRRWNEKGES